MRVASSRSSFEDENMAAAKEIGLGIQDWKGLCVMRSLTVSNALICLLLLAYCGY